MTLDEMLAQYIQEKIVDVIDKTVRGEVLTNYIDAVARDSVRDVVETWMENNIKTIADDVLDNLDLENQVREIVGNMSFSVEVS